MFGPWRKNRFGKPRDGRAEVRLGGAGPHVGQRPPRAADEALGDGQVVDVEAGREHEHVGRVLAALGIDDAGRTHARRGAGDGHRRLRERGVVVVREEEPLAAEAVVGLEAPPQLEVSDLRAEVVARDCFGALAEARVPEGEPEHLVAPIERVADHPLQPRPVREASAERAVVARDHPRGRPLKERQAGHTGLDGRHDLDRRGARPHDGDTPAVDFDRLVPPRRVHDSSGERVEAGEGGDPRLGERPGRGDDDVGRPVAPARADEPAGRAVVPHGLLDVRAEADVRRHAALHGDPLEVRLDLGLP